MRDKCPVDFFFLFVGEGLLGLMVRETNKYAFQKLNKATTPKARIQKWKNTNQNEMKIFLGLQIWFGLVMMQKLECYCIGRITFYILHKSKKLCP